MSGIFPSRSSSPRWSEKGKAGFSQIDTTNLSLSELRNTISELDKLNFDLKMRIFYLEERLQKVEGEAQKSGKHDAAVIGFKEIIDLKQMVAKRDREIDQVTRRNHDLERQMSNLRQENMGLEDQLRTQAQKDRKNLGSTAERHRAEVELLEQKLRQERSRNRILKTEKDEVIVELENELRKYKDTAALGAGTMARHAEQVKFLLTQDQQKVEQVNNFHKECLRLLQELDEVRSRLGERDREIGQLQAEVVSAKTANAKVKERDLEIMRLKAEITVLEDQLGGQSEELTSHRLELQDIRKSAEEVCSLEAEEIQRLESEVAKLSAAIKSQEETERLLHERMKQNESDTQRAKAQCEAYKQSYEQQQQEHLYKQEELTAKCEDYAQRLSVLQDQNAQLSWKLAAAAESQAQQGRELVRVNSHLSQISLNSSLRNSDGFIQRSFSPIPQKCLSSSQPVEEDALNSPRSLASSMWKSSASQIEAAVTSANRKIETLMDGIVPKGDRLPEKRLDDYLNEERSKEQQYTDHVERDNNVQSAHSSSRDDRRSSTKQYSLDTFKDKVPSPDETSPDGTWTRNSHIRSFNSFSTLASPATHSSRRGSRTGLLGLSFWEPTSFHQNFQETNGSTIDVLKKKLEQAKAALQSITDPSLDKERAELQAMVDALMQACGEHPGARDTASDPLTNKTSLVQKRPRSYSQSESMSSSHVDQGFSADVSAKAEQIMDRHKWFLEQKENFSSQQVNQFGGATDDVESDRKQLVDHYMNLYMQSNEISSWSLANGNNSSKSLRTAQNQFNNISAS